MQFLVDRQETFQQAWQGVLCTHVRHVEETCPNTFPTHDHEEGGDFDLKRLLDEM